jgi:hypothetical protein
MEVLVEHDYVAKEPSELTITKGDIIKDVIKKQGGWWEGTLNDKKGLFPDNFVKVIDKDPVVVFRNRKDAARIRQCRVVFSYKQDHEDELNLNVGDIIDILGEEEEGWWRGILHGKQGVFPSNFVEEIVPVPTKLTSSKENLTNSAGGNNVPPLFAKPTKILCEVKFPYKAQNEDELTLKEGDLVTLLSKDGQDPGWWKGELNGVVGVFPDNFVTVLPSPLDEGSVRDDKRAKSLADPLSIKPSTISAQRKSLETVNNEKVEADTSIKTTPPLPGKKPNVPVKKSPSNSGSSGSLFHGLKKRFVDVIDGGGGSKMSPPKIEPGESSTNDNAFDDVHRRPLLQDVRASRPKAPGRRPPSIIGKDPEPGLMNGSTDHNVMEMPTESLLFGQNAPTEDDPAENKPKLPEWVKHPAPWLEEMKLNQAKRSSSVPGPEKLKLTPTDKNEADETKSKSIKKEPSPVDKSKSIINLSSRMKTPPNEFAVIRNKPNVPTPSRPQTIQTLSNLTDVYSQQKQSTQIHTKVSPITNKTPSPMQKTEANVDSHASGDCLEETPQKNYFELRQRIAKLEELVEKQQRSHEAAIDELRGKLQIETEMRMELQAKFERFISDGAIQQI